VTRKSSGHEYFGDRVYFLSPSRCVYNQKHMSKHSSRCCRSRSFGQHAFLGQHFVEASVAAQFLFLFILCPGYSRSLSSTLSLFGTPRVLKSKITIVRVMAVPFWVSSRKIWQKVIVSQLIYVLVWLIKSEEFLIASCLVSFTSC